MLFTAETGSSSRMMDLEKPKQRASTPSGVPSRAFVHRMHRRYPSYSTASIEQKNKIRGFTQRERMYRWAFQRTKNLQWIYMGIAKDERERKSTYGDTRAWDDS